jgi:hypothetical protein
MQEALESGDFGEAIQEPALVDGIVGRSKAFFFDRVEQPGAFDWIFDVGDLVASGTAVHLLEAMDRLEGVGQVGSANDAAYN